MNLILQAVLAFALGMAPVQPQRGIGPEYEGYAARYAPGVMKRVALNRGLSIESCMVSSPLFAIGEWVYVYGHVTGERLKCRVTDTSAPVDKKRHIRNRLFAELNYDAARIICGSVTNRNDECPISIQGALDIE